MPPAEQRIASDPDTVEPEGRMGWSCVALELSGEALASYGEALGLQSSSVALDALLQAIAHSPEWQQLAGAHLIARSQPTPRIAAFGRFDPIAVAALEAQARQLNSACQNFRCFDFEDVVADCRSLATQLEAHLGEELSRAHFVAIPRGGLVALGLLASELGLRAEQLVAVGELDSQVPCVVVDDCAISGSRFQDFLPTVAATRVVFAQLVSPRGLRTACAAAEPRVEACLAGRDLPLLELGDQAAAWQDQWQKRDGAGRYWLGSPVPFCLPWNEPERQVWNPRSQATETAWRLAPPDICSKNGSWPAEHRPRCYGMPTAAGSLRPGDAVLAVSPDAEIPDTRVPNTQVTVLAGGDGQCYELRGVAASLWSAVVEFGHLEPAVDRLEAEFEVDRESLERDCETLVAQLLERSLLVDTPVVG